MDGKGDRGRPHPHTPAAGSAYLQVTCLVQPPPPGPTASGGTAAKSKAAAVAPAAAAADASKAAAAAAPAVVPRATASAITVYPTQRQPRNFREHILPARRTGRSRAAAGRSGARGRPAVGQLRRSVARRLRPVSSLARCGRHLRPHGRLRLVERNAGRQRVGEWRSLRAALPLSPRGPGGLTARLGPRPAEGHLDCGAGPQRPPGSSQPRGVAALA